MPGVILCPRITLVNEEPQTASPARRPASWGHTAGRPKAMGRRAAVCATGGSPRYPLFPSVTPYFEDPFAA